MGHPQSAERTAMTLRGEKGNLYEGGIRVPGVLEWPAVLQKPLSTSAIASTTDILPTLVEITGQALPERPLDGETLIPIINNHQKQRNEPLYFWKFNSGNVFDEFSQPYIDPKLQEGTTPLVKMMNGKYTRSFRNFKYDEISQNDFVGERTMMKNNYKLIIEGKSS